MLRCSKMAVRRASVSSNGALAFTRIARGERTPAGRGGSRPRLHDFTLSHARETSQAQPSVEAHDAETVVRVAQFGRDARAVGHGAPGDLVAPGAAAGDAAGPGQRAVGVQGRRGEVVPLLVPVHAPLVAGAREVGKAVAVR